MGDITLVEHSKVRHIELFITRDAHTTLTPLSKPSQVVIALFHMILAFSNSLVCYYMLDSSFALLGDKAPVS